MVNKKVARNFFMQILPQIVHTWQDLKGGEQKKKSLSRSGLYLEIFFQNSNLVYIAEKKILVVSLSNWPFWILWCVYILQPITSESLQPDHGDG